MKGAYRFFHSILASPFRFLLNIRVSGQEYEPDAGSGGYLVCANHVSGWDVIWLAVALKKRQIHYMAKAELFKIPLLGWLIRSLGAFPVHRGTADVSSVRTTIAIIEGGGCVCIFPQGTRYVGVNPLDTSVRSGAGMIAFRAGASVIPVFIKTKNFKPTVFGRKDVIIGKQIPGSLIKEMHNEGAEYSKISRYIFNEVCALGSSPDAEVPN